MFVVQNQRRPTLIRPRHLPAVEKRAVAYVEQPVRYEGAVPDRPAYLEDTVIIDDTRKGNILRQKVMKYASAIPERPAFDTVPPVPRQFAGIIDFPKPKEVRLAKETIAQLQMEEVPDPDDGAWLKEYKRRKDDGETDEQLRRFPPLGRKQRTIRRKKITKETTPGPDIGALRASLDAMTQAIDKLVEDIKTGGLQEEKKYTAVANSLDTILNAYLDGGDIKNSDWTKLRQSVALITSYSREDYGLPAVITDLTPENRLNVAKYLIAQQPAVWGSLIQEGTDGDPEEKKVPTYAVEAPDDTSFLTREERFLFIPEREEGQEEEAAPQEQKQEVGRSRYVKSVFWDINGRQRTLKVLKRFLEVEDNVLFLPLRKIINNAEIPDEFDDNPEEEEEDEDDEGEEEL